MVFFRDSDITKCSYKLVKNGSIMQMIIIMQIGNCLHTINCDVIIRKIQLLLSQRVHCSAAKEDMYLNNKIVIMVLNIKRKLN